MRINKHDTNGTKPLLSKGELGYDDYTAGGDTGRVYVGTGAENIALAEKLEANTMTKAQFNALAEERKANRAGSGFDEWGKHSNNGSSIINVNDGMTVVYNSANANTFYLGYLAGVGTSKTENPIISINGTRHSIAYTNIANINNKVFLPQAPNIYPYNTVLTSEQIASGVIKHADASNSGLVVNGKFDTDTSGWTTYGGGSITQTSGMLKTQSASERGRGYQYFTNLVVGKRYVVEAMVASDGVTEAGVYCASIDNVGAFDYGILKATISETTLKYKKIEFTAITSNLMLCCTTLSNIHPSTSYSYFDNIAVFPADAISRSDLSMAESFHEDIAEKGFGYPLGNTQYLGGNTDGLTGITNGAFTGFETYSLFGNWQTSSALIGKGYVWSTLTEAQKKAFIANPENNCYLDGDKVIQVRYRVRVVQGLGDNWVNVDPQSTVNNSLFSYSSTGGSESIVCLVEAKGKLTNVLDMVSSSSSIATYYGANHTSQLGSTGVYTAGKANTLVSAVAYESKCYALPIALVHRRNQGMYHPVYNPNGSKKASDGNFWYNTAVSFTNISDCFDPAKLLTASGYIGTVSGRPDGLFYDQVHESDILDLRNSSKKVEDYNRLISREFNKLVAGTNRGKEGEFELLPYISQDTDGTSGNALWASPMGSNTFNANVSVGDIITIIGININGIVRIYKDIVVSTATNTISLKNPVARSNGTYYIAKKSTRTKSNTLLHCDIIGNPANYPASWKQSGVFGTPLIVAEDGTSLLPDGVKDTFKLSRKANATPLLCLRSTDNGVTWTSFTPTFSTTTNAITLTDEPAGNLVVIYYQTYTSMATPVVNSEVLEIGDASAYSYYTNAHSSRITQSLLGKVPTGSVDGTILQGFKVSNFYISASTGNKLNTASVLSPVTSVISLVPSNSSPAVKVLPYLTRLNGKAYLNLVFKEMKHNGTSWGDDNKFNIVDNVSTTTDNNAQTVLIGQKTVELPYFIGADE